MTKKEAKQIFLNRGFVEVDGGSIFDGDKWREACRVISEWLEQEPILDKIRAEIDEEYRNESEHPYGHGLRRAIEIIDKYKAESEVSYE